MSQSTTVSERRRASLLSDLVLIRGAEPSWRPVAVWSALAALSLAIAVVVALRPDQLQDLRVVRQWMQYWLSTGANPYPAFHIAPKLPGFETTLDYPPSAFLLLWPAGALSWSTLVAVFVPLSIAGTAAGGYLLLNWMATTVGVALATRERLALVALLLAGDAVRLSLWHGQTMPLALLLAALALHHAPRRPWLAMLALGLAAYKPHVALGVGLALMLTGAVRVVAGGVVVAVALTWTFAALVGRSLPGILGDYAANLQVLYTGVDRTRGMLSLRFVVEDITGSYTFALVATVAAGVITLLWLAMAARRRPDPVGRALAMSAALAWSLLFLPTQRYHAVFAAPALWLLMWPESGVARTHRGRLIAVAACVLFSVVDVPLAMRVVSRWHPALDGLFWDSFALSPLQVAALLAGILAALHRDAPGEGSRPDSATI